MNPLRLIGSVPHYQVEPLADGAILHSYRRHVHETLRMGPNEVHAVVIHADGDITDLGISHNLITNIGKDYMAWAQGGAIPAGGAGSPATATSASSLTATGTPWTATALGTPQFGIAGFRIYASVTGITTPPVYMNVSSNTTSVASGDQWWTAADGVGTTPAATNAFILGAGGMSAVRFMAVTTDAAAASASDTVLATENNANGVSRALATFAHTMGTSTYTLLKSWSPSGAITAIHKMGLYPHMVPTVGPVIFESVLNADATVVNGDTFQVTDTVTLS
jgi:hypothetical protein